MHRRSLAILLATCVGGAVAISSASDAPRPSASRGTIADGNHRQLAGRQPAPVMAGYGDLPLSFEPNQGQRAGDATFLARGRGYELHLRASGAVLSLERVPDGRNEPGQPASSPRRGDAKSQVTMTLVGGRATAPVTGVDRLPGHVNYLVGADASRWRTRIPTYRAVRVDDVYRGIDLVYYGNQGELEYDFIVEPGADPKAIALRFGGVGHVALADDGDLLLRTGGGEVRQLKPVLYQDIDGERRTVAGHYAVRDGVVTIEAGEYDRRQPLVIDPVLIYSGYLGSGRRGEGIAVDALGHAYVAGWTSTPGPRGQRDAFVMKVNPAGSSVMFATYVGGASDDFAYDVAVDANGAVYLTGYTRSADFPTAQAFDFTLGGTRDAFVTKLTGDGATIVYSSYLGSEDGGTQSELGTAIAVHNEHAYVVGYTPGQTFPTTPDAVKPTHGQPAGGFRGFFTKIGPSGALVHSTYLGGLTGNDRALGVATDAAGSAYVTGRTTSREYLVKDPIQTWEAGEYAFVTKLSASGALVYSTYLGGSLGHRPTINNTEGHGIAVGADGSAYVTGSTRAINFPTTDGAYDRSCDKRPSVADCMDAFVTKLNPAGTAFVYSTYLGGLESASEFERGNAIAVDAAGRAYVTGSTDVTDFPVLDAFKSTITAADAQGGDSFVTVLNAAGSGLVYSSYLGGTRDALGFAGFDEALAIALDPQGNAYITGVTLSSDFPIAGGFGGSAPGDHVDYAGGFVAKISAVGCAYTATPTSSAAPAAGGSFSVSVTTSAGCGWGAGSSSGASWLTVSSVGGSGSGSVTVTAAANPSVNPRMGQVTIAGVAVTVSQPAAVPCTFTVTPTNHSAPAVGGVVNVTVTTGAGCAWTASGGPAWLSTVPSNGTGSGNVSVTASPNSTTNQRSGQVTIAGTMLTVTQPGGAPTNCPNDADCDGLPTSWETQFGLDGASAEGASGAGGDPDNDGRTNAQELAAGTHPRGLHMRYFAEGATGAFFDMRIALVNPGATTARVLLRFQTSTGSAASQAVTVAPNARATVLPEQIAGLSIAEFSTVVESDVPVVADRTMTWNTTGYGSHAETSLPAPATRWYLAEGATHSGFNLFYLIQNPSNLATTVEVRYLLPAPAAPVVKTYQVAANSRFNIWVNQEGGALASSDVSAIISSPPQTPVIVERAMYRDSGGQTFGAGHNSAGITTPSTNWFLAEGATGTFFDLFVLVANPNDTAASVTATYLLPSGQTVVKTYSVAANARFNIWVDFEDAALADTAVSTTLASTVPVIVERAMWWPFSAANWFEAHNSPGATVTGTKWALAEGEVGGASTTETYVLIANVSPTPGTARVTLLFEDGSTTSGTFALEASSRFNVDIRNEFAAAVGRRFGVVVESIGETPAQIVVERAMYSNAGGVVWAAGTNALATRLQ